MTDAPPGILAEIAELVGLHLTEVLAIELGGKNVHVPLPAGMTKRNPLWMAIGPEGAAEIAGRFGREDIYVPRARRWVARRMFARGASAAEVARRLHVTRSAARGYRRGG